MNVLQLTFRNGYISVKTSYIFTFASNLYKHIHIVLQENLVKGNEMSLDSIDSDIQVNNFAIFRFADFIINSNE